MRIKRIGCDVHKDAPALNCLVCAGLTLPRRKRRTRTATTAPTEHEEQAAFFAWTRDPSVLAEYPEVEECFAVPNFSGRFGNSPPVYAIRQAQMLNEEGRKAGVEDVMLLVARGGYHGLLLETKRVNAAPSAVAPEQRKWHAIHFKRGYKVVVCRGREELKATVIEYLSQPVTRVIYRVPNATLPAA